jgi:hypothetical protein
MEEIELEQLRKHPKWGAVLEQYHRLSVQNREQSTDFDGWIPRLPEIPEIPNDELSGIHGKLIAFGFLKFDLTGRDGGIRYQLTPLGKRGTDASTPSELDGDETNDDRPIESVVAFNTSAKNFAAIAQ